MKSRTLFLLWQLTVLFDKRFGLMTFLKSVLQYCSLCALIYIHPIKCTGACETITLPMGVSLNDCLKCVCGCGGVCGWVCVWVWVWVCKLVNLTRLNYNV